MLGVAVACVPVLLAVVGPLLEGHTPASRLIAAALVVTAARLCQGFGRADAIGLLWALVTFACGKAGFTLLAVPVLGRHGPIGVSVHATWMAALLFGVTGVGWGGAGGGAAARRRGPAGRGLSGGRRDGDGVRPLVHLRRGAAPPGPGLLTGIAPIAAAATGMALGGPRPSLLVWLGVAVVAAGLALGLTQRDRVRLDAGPRERDLGGDRTLPATPADQVA